MLGRRFGKLVVMHKTRAHPTIKKDAYYHCVCDCGGVCEARATALRKNKKKSCGCLKEITNTSHWVGRKVGKLFVLKKLPDRKYLCRCDCGAEIVSTSMWSRSRTEGAHCGGVAHRKTSVVIHKHVFVGQPSVKLHPLYARWANMKDRCENENNRDYRLYGGRGITLHTEWSINFWEYAEYVRNLPRPEGRVSLDRIDNNRGYMPGNLRWATPSEQMENSRSRSWLRDPDPIVAPGFFYP